MTVGAALCLWLDLLSRFAVARCDAAPEAGAFFGGGASPLATDNGSFDNPMCWLASRVADQATAALNPMPRKATSHSAARRLMVGRRYSAPG